MNMFKSKQLFTFFFTCCLLFLQYSSFGNSASKDVVIEDGQSLLWKIEHLEIPHPSYLYGTMHIIPESDFKIGKRLREIFLSSDLLLMEVDLDNESMMETAMLTIIPGGKTIRDFMSPEDYEILYAYMRDTLELDPMELMTYQHIKPIMLIEVLSANMMGENTVSYEFEFSALAAKHKIPVKALETAAEQIAFLDEIPLEEQAKAMLDYITADNESNNYLLKMIELYKNQQIDALYQMIIEDESLIDHTETLLYTRNKNWIEPITSLISEQKVFIAVGAGHLSGEEGVINLLRNNGYTVTAVSTEKVLIH